MAPSIPDAKEKLSYYRNAAEKAGQRAREASEADIRTAYLSIQSTWTYLADELEREMALEDGFAIDAPDGVFAPAAESNPAHKAR
jgi:chemotaxis regulatin CheY-phosphate phosphatase CheZ